MNVKAYLERVGIDCEPSLTYDFLKKLQYAHVTTVPYENLDIINKKPLDLSVEALYKKVVTEGRGGYCFELNGLLAALLREIGFNVTDYLGRFLKGEGDIPVRRHRIVGVILDGVEYTLDVGMGTAGPREPLVLEEGSVQTVRGERYKYKKDTDLGWVLYEETDNGFEPFYSFTTEKQYEVDFIEPSFYCEKHPDSIFNRLPIVAVKTDKGRKTVSEFDFKEFEGRTLVRSESKMSVQKLCELLKNEFGIAWTPSTEFLATVKV